VQRAELEHAIAVLVGEPPARFAIAPAPFSATVPETPMTLPSALLERRPDVASAERQVAAANAQIGVAKAAYYPTVTLGAIGGFNSTEASNLLSLPSRFWALGASATMTLFDGGRRKALNEQAQAAYDGSVAAYRQTVLTAFADVEDNLAALRVLADEAADQDRAIDSSRRSLRHTTLRYEGGVVSYLEVAISQSFTLTIERTAIDIARRRKIASVRLIKAVGGDWNVADLPADADLLARRGSGAR
jgi:NodT family efflux transporter outer membrane factor (OMF) lipoprotein